jgi:L,D-peptidoglycan transpeptidase YkuD (ErfK/YbiS/YcfS/YnhG family)
MKIIVKNNTLLYDDFIFKCSIGKNGISTKKIEGDKKTPKGLYSLGPLYFRNDRVSEPKTLLKSIPIKEDVGWCDDVKSKFYNKIINTKKKLRHEKLFIKKNDYDLLIPINYNTKKTKKGKGSAIFLHLTKNYKKTLGCIAIKKKDMIILLKIITQKTKIEIT